MACEMSQSSRNHYTGDSVRSFYQKHVKAKKKTYEELEESDHSDESQEMSSCSNDGTELCPRAHHWSEEEGHKEQRQQHRGVPNDGPNGDDGDTNQRARGLVTFGVGEGLDEHVSNNEDRGDGEGRDDFGEEDCAPRCSGNVARQLLRWVPKLLLLVTGDHGTRKTTVPIPTARLRPRVAARHPTQEFSVVNDEVGEGELMGIKHERRDAQGEDRRPEVEQVGCPQSDGRVE